jgi:hypothetical protein
MMDQIDHSRQIVISWQAEYRILMNKIEELLMRSICIIVSNEAAVRSKDGCEHRRGPAQMPRLPREVGDPGEHPNTLHTEDYVARESPGARRWGSGRRRASGRSTGPT